MNENFCTVINTHEIGSVLPAKKQHKNKGTEFQVSRAKNHHELDAEITLFYCHNSSCEKERGKLYNCMHFSTVLHSKYRLNI